MGLRRHNIAASDTTVRDMLQHEIAENGNTRGDEFLVAC